MRLLSRREQTAGVGAVVVVPASGTGGTVVTEEEAGGVPGEVLVAGLGHRPFPSVPQLTVGSSRWVIALSIVMDPKAGFRHVHQAEESQAAAVAAAAVVP